MNERLQVVMPNADARWVREFAQITGLSVSEVLRRSWFNYGGKHLPEPSQTELLFTGDKR